MFLPADRGQVARAPVEILVRVQVFLSQGLSFRGEDAGTDGLLEKGLQIVISLLLIVIAGAVTAVVADIYGLIPLRRLGGRLCGGFVEIMFEVGVLRFLADPVED